MDDEDILVYWLRIRRLGSVKKHLLQVVD